MKKEVFTELINKTIEKEECSFEEADKLVRWYWRSIHNDVSNMEHFRLRIIGFGDFYIVRKRILTLLGKYKSLKRMLHDKVEATRKTKDYNSYNTVEYMLSRMFAFLADDKKEKARKHEIKKVRYEK